MISEALFPAVRPPFHPSQPGKTTGGSTMFKAHRITVMSGLALLAMLVAATLFPGAWAQEKTSAKPGPAAAAVSQTKINVNTASPEELGSLKGIGPKMAEKIIAFRKANGPFKEPDDLLKVDGIGPKLLESIKDLIAVK
jgi:competence protein ComEA